MTMRFVFSSEEYPEFTNSIYQDFVGVWVNGQQVGILAGNGDVDGDGDGVSNGAAIRGAFPSRPSAGPGACTPPRSRPPWA